jgi:hypothetical protein
MAHLVVMPRPAQQDVGLALLSQLGNRPSPAPEASQALTLEEFCADRRTRCSRCGGAGTGLGLRGRPSSLARWRVADCVLR